MRFAIIAALLMGGTTTLAIGNNALGQAGIQSQTYWLLTLAGATVGLIILWIRAVYKHVEWTENTSFVLAATSIASVLPPPLFLAIIMDGSPELATSISALQKSTITIMPALALTMFGVAAGYPQEKKRKNGK